MVYGYVSVFVFAELGTVSIVDSNTHQSLRAQCPKQASAKGPGHTNNKPSNYRAQQS